MGRQGGGRDENIGIVQGSWSRLGVPPLDSDSLSSMNQIFSPSTTPCSDLLDDADNRTDLFRLAGGVMERASSQLYASLKKVLEIRTLTFSLILDCWTGRNYILPNTPFGALSSPSNIMKFCIVILTLSTSSMAAAYRTSEIVYERAYDDDIVGFTARAIWGKGKYAMNESDYHTRVKPGLKTAFAQHYKNFVAFCGTNPDFHCDRNGMTKFPPLPLGDSHVLPHLHRRSYVDLFDDLD
ncbi:hypothetical protein D9619_011102 [Psilocybe cf. subviscida]|uniref:Uncharacterized protein n=1 Tax=Psilocybe cf. subviscida TaxID=2480587 RepID=A0A8H5BKU2_9AGAR|nr:hypothetical protein D9619_011102 [Psilocybe cf. subviscida]